MKTMEGCGFELRKKWFNHVVVIGFILLASCSGLWAKSYQLEPDRVADPDFKNDTPLQRVREFHGFDTGYLYPPDSYPQHYEREIVLKLTERIGSNAEYQNASDTEKALHWWIPEDGDYKKLPAWGLDDTGNIYMLREKNLDFSGLYAKREKTMVHRFNTRGEYRGTRKKGQPQFQQWKQFATKFYYTGSKEIKIKGWAEFGKFVSEFQEAYGIQYVDTALKGISSQHSLPRKQLRLVDEELNFYKDIYIRNNKVYRSKNDRFYHGKYKGYFGRSFLEKYNKHGGLMAGVEILPSYQSMVYWGSNEPTAGQQYFKLINSKKFYVLGITYTLDHLDLYVFKYERVNR